MKREGRTLEYKSQVESYGKICRTVVAFSNDIGGRILLGVEDKTLKVLGLDETHLERYYEDIPKAIFDSISPYCLPEITTRLIENNTVMVITVFKGQRKPYFIRSEGIPKGVYFRVGAHTRRADPELLEDLIREGERRTWDEESTQSSMEALDTQLLRQLYPDGAAEELLEADHVIRRNPVLARYTLTHAGMVFFGRTPTEILPQCEVLYSEFQGEKERQPTRTLDLTGPLPALAQKAFELLKPHVIGKERVQDLKRKTVDWRIPDVAIREVLLNALIHRRYTASSAIKVAVFSDRIEVFSPGNFPGPISASDIGNGVSYSRNPRIRQLARKAGLVEKRGLGFGIILRACEENGNRRPLIVEGDDYVKVTLYFERASRLALPAEDELTALTEWQKENRPFQTHEASQLLKVSINTARSRLSKLVKTGLLEVRGSGRSTTYHWRN